MTMPGQLELGLDTIVPPSDTECRWCGSPATRLCDFVLGYPDVEERERLMAAGDDPHFTCDLLICDTHATVTGRMHMCKRGKGCSSDTIDRCPAHIEQMHVMRAITKAKALEMRTTAASSRIAEVIFGPNEWW